MNVAQRDAGGNVQAVKLRLIFCRRAGSFHESGRLEKLDLSMDVTGGMRALTFHAAQAAEGFHQRTGGHLGKVLIKRAVDVFGIGRQVGHGEQIALGRLHTAKMPQVGEEGFDEEPLVLVNGFVAIDGGGEDLIKISAGLVFGDEPKGQSQANGVLACGGGSSCSRHGLFPR